MSFYCLQEIPEPLLAPVQVLGHPYGEKKINFFICNYNFLMSQLVSIVLHPIAYSLI